jgi:hypothetical protein
MGRFLITPVALLAPLFANILVHRRYAIVVSAASVLTLVPNLLLDHAKPSGLTGGASIWAMTRSQAQAVQQPQILPVIEALSSQVPDTARIGYALGGDDWDYPLYGSRLSRRLDQLDSGHVCAEATRKRLDWILARQTMIGPIGSGWQATNFSGVGLTLLRRDDP